MSNQVEIGDVIAGIYTLKFKLGESGICDIYRASGDGDKQYQVAFQNSAKLSRNDISDGVLLQQEILQNLKTPSVIRFVDGGEHISGGSKYHYLVTELISGESLQDKLAREGVQSRYYAEPLILDILNVLQEMHSHPEVIIHNNITPASIMLDYSQGDERPVLSDFEFARYIASRTGSVDYKRLNPFYTAPELFNGVFTPQSDLYSIGALLYNLIMGIPPWYVEVPSFQYTDEKLIDAIMDKRSKGLAFSGSPLGEPLGDHIKGVITKALAYDVGERFASAEEFSRALKRDVVLDRRDTAVRIKSPVRKTNTGGGGFSAIAGMQELKDILYNDVIRALDEQELYEDYGLTIPNGMLLYGPPGCGKTFISMHFAEEVGFNFLQLNPSDIKSKYVNETEEKIGAIFKEAIENAPTIIFIDEFDAVVPSRDHDLHHMHASSVNEMLAQMSNCGEKGVFVIAATNRPDKIDAAVLRTGRIDRIIYLPPPDHEARACMFELYLKNRPVDIAMDYDALAQLTENYVSSDIKFLVDEASRRALQSKDRISQSTMEDVIALKPPSLSTTEIRQYESMKSKLENKRDAEEPHRPIGFL